MRRVMASVKRLIDQESNETWARLYAKLILNAYGTEQILSRELFDFISNSAFANGTNSGFLLASLITTINFILSKNKSFVQIRNGFYVNLNTLIIFVGQPSTGKSPAIKLAVTNSIGDNLSDNVISSSTSSGLTKFLSKKRSAFFVNQEITEYINKMFKNDEYHSGDFETICKLYSGKAITLSYATEDQRVIEKDLAFCILGATQVKSMAHLLGKLENLQNGFLDRFLISIPPPFHPLPDDQIVAKEKLAEYNLSMKDIYESLESRLDPLNRKIFYLHDQSASIFKNIEKEYINELNDNMMKGVPTVTSKKCDLIPKVAVALHVLESMLSICRGTETVISEEIDPESFNRAVTLVESLEEQKETFKSFLVDLLPTKKTVTQTSPSTSDYMKSVQLSPGKIVSIRSYRSSTSRKFRKIMKKEFLDVIQIFQVRAMGESWNTQTLGHTKKSSCS